MHSAIDCTLWYIQTSELRAHWEKLPPSSLPSLCKLTERCLFSLQFVCQRVRSIVHSAIFVNLPMIMHAKTGVENAERETHSLMCVSACLLPCFCSVTSQGTSRSSRSTWRASVKLVGGGHVYVTFECGWVGGEGWGGGHLYVSSECVWECVCESVTECIHVMLCVFLCTCLVVQGLPELYTYVPYTIVYYSCTLWAYHVWMLCAFHMTFLTISGTASRSVELFVWAYLLCAEGPS
jgi:hypothetical protein